MGKGDRTSMKTPEGSSISSEMAQADFRTPTKTPSARMAEHVRSTVLYVEDSPTNLFLVSEILSTRPNITFLSAANAELGIELARARCPDLILMDINLPGMDGIAATKKLQTHEETRAIPVIAVSAYATEAEKKNAMAAGFKEYVTKPFNISEFLETIDEILKEGTQGGTS